MGDPVATPGDHVGVAVRLATLAGTAVRLSRALLGPAAAAAVSIGLGELAGHVFGRGLAPWVAIVIGGGFGLLLASELHAAPRAPIDRPEA